MADYLYLTDEEKAQIVASFAPTIPDPVQVVHDAEREHFRLSVEAALRGQEPEPYEPPDVTELEQRLSVLEAQAVAFPLPIEVELPIEEIPTGPLPIIDVGPPLDAEPG